MSQEGFSVSTVNPIKTVLIAALSSFYVIRWMTYCEGAILSLTHSLTHSIAHSHAQSAVIQRVTAGKAVRTPFNFSGFPQAKHNFLKASLSQLLKLRINREDLS